MPSSELSVMFCYVYVLRSLEYNQIYVGFTKDLKARVAEHNKGLNKSTKRYLPWELIYYEAHRNKIDTQRREKYLKTTSGGRAINNMLREELSMKNNRKSTTRYV